MSWRLVTTLIVALFAILVVMTMTAQPMHTATDAITDLDSDNSDLQEQADSSVRGYFNLILVLIFGLIAWASWWILRRELTTNQL